MLSYFRSHHRCRLQKLLALYFQFKGVSAKGFDTLHAMGLTMSHTWTAETVARISKDCMNEVKRKLDVLPWLMSYDNVNIPFRVFSQRLDNQGEFGNGTAATVYVKPGAEPMLPDANARLKQCRAEGMMKPLTELEIMDLADASYPLVQRDAIHHVLRVLLDSPEFNLPTYKWKQSGIFDRPPCVHQVKTGPEHRTLQYLLGTSNIPEVSYEDNSRLVDEWMSQLGWGKIEDQKKLATEKVVMWIGDQLTVDRLRGLAKYRAEDQNSYARLDFSVFIFGWFHLQMAFANSLHRQYEGTPSTHGLKHAFTLLEKKGLHTVQTKGPFHHDLQETLYHIAEAHLREDWCEIAQVEDLGDLRSLTPQELEALATKIVRERASSEAIDLMDAKPKKQQDQQLRQLIMWNRDILQYIVLDQAIKRGDIGQMEGMLPHLLFRFIGGGNGKYAGEILELLQQLHRELPMDIACAHSNFLRTHTYSCYTEISYMRTAGSSTPQDLRMRKDLSTKLRNTTSKILKSHTVRRVPTSTGTT